MAPKAEDENIKYLYICFQSAVKNGGKVDMKAVAEVYGINANAAGMRLTRLKKVLEPAGGVTANDDADNAAAADEAPKAAKKPRTKAPKADATDASPAYGTEPLIPASSLVTKGKGKGKKRKLNEEEQVDGLIQRAGLAAVSDGDMDPQATIDHLRDVMMQTNDEDLKAECKRKILIKEENVD